MRLKLNGIENLNEIEPIIIKIDQKKMNRFLQYIN